MTSSRTTKLLSCTLPRNPQAVGALFSLLWKKQKKDRPDWILEELKEV